MITERRESKAWLFWTALLLLSVFVAVAFVSRLEPSQALTSPVAKGHVAAPLGAGIEGKITYTDVITSYSYLPAVFNDFSFAHLTLSKVAFPATFVAAPGKVVTYTVTIKNEGDTAGTLLTVSDTLPAGFSFLSMAPGSDPGSAPAVNGSQLTWSGSWAMAPGQQRQLIFRVTASQTPGQYTNRVTCTAANAQVPSQAAWATVTVQPPILMQDDFNSGIDRWTAFLNYHYRLEEGQWYWGSYDGTNTSGALTHDCCSGPTHKVASDGLMMYLQPGAQEWTNYRVEAKMLLRGGVNNEGDPEPTSGDPIGLWVRGHYKTSDINAQWVDGYYVVIVGKTDDPVHWVRLAQMQIPGDCTTACDRPQNQYAFNNPFLLQRSADLPGPFEHYRWYTLAVEARGNNIKVFLDGQLLIDYTDTVLPFMSGTVGFKVHETKTASFDDIIVTSLP